ncbi:glycoside hydrolase family 66 protein [uncultured Draconibacterium sp.]|uniref:glycoside hydrolase family 66 protein n=1 Tax=uncultured Draconibacterium sp. TaxID=1573823 RepID=UPI002611DD91|nr:glycoside hydrolase family 66 protein [uncultured Draconibacterium sp.]
MRENKVQIVVLLMLLFLQMGCGSNEEIVPPVAEPEFPTNPSLPGFNNYFVETDKSIYNPGDEVQFNLDITSVPENTKVRYKYLGEVVLEHALTNSSWVWNVPSEDFKAYMVEVYTTANNAENILAAIAVDVSSNWTKFPRYGFLSDYSNIDDETISSVLKNLNRHHINGIQFYDWHHKHHQPMAVDGDSPKAVWKDIANRDIYFSTVEKYIENAHNYNMKAMFYNLVYGAWDHAEQDGVKAEWYIFKDAGRINKEVMTLPQPPFLSNIFLLDPSNTEWQAYINNENKKVYQYLDFDGFHMDQLGDWGQHYTYHGNSLSLYKTFKPFIESVRTSEPDKFIAMNAVNQYGQENIASASTDFLYTEVWGPNDTYNDLAMIIQNNNSYSDNTKNTILAAYMNYDLAENQGYFNTPGVLLTNAVIFAFGGAHLELGEHMLGKEYFPNNNLKMKSELKTAMVHYYDFLVAYQNILRDGGEFNAVEIQSAENKYPISQWPAQTGNIVSVGKKVGNRQVVHLINFKDANTNEWRDNNGTQSRPALMENIPISINISEKVSSIWFASPDANGGTSVSLNFTQQNGEVLLTVPQLKYWSTIVLELE